MSIKKPLTVLIGLLLLLSSYTAPVNACTGIRLTAKDGSVVFGRTLEWGTFDLLSRLAIIPRGYEFTGLTPDGLNGKKWQTKYGVVGIDMLKKDLYGDAINEKGLFVGLFYHPGVAKYLEYDKAQASNTITAVDVVSYISTQFATIAEAKQAMKKVRVVAVLEPAIGIPVQAHWIVVEPSGKSIVIEYLKGKLRIFDNPLGVITNSPAFDWHMTNLRNYVNLSPVALPTKKIQDLDFTPLGGGSGMIGLPGDFTPPSRFVRAVAWSQTHRPIADSDEAIYELFRILDNFNVPLGASEGAAEVKDAHKGMRSSTLWTSGWDISKKRLYYHTQHNRRIRMLDIGKVDFSGKKITHLQLDRGNKQDVEDITPR